MALMETLFLSSDPRVKQEIGGGNKKHSLEECIPADEVEW